MGKEKGQEQVAGREATGDRVRTRGPSGRAPAVRSMKTTLAFAAGVRSVDVPSDTARLQNRESAQRTAGHAGSGTRRLLRVSFCLLDHKCYSTANVPAEGFSARRRTNSNGTQQRRHPGSGRFDCYRRCLDCVSHSRWTHSTNCTTCPNGATTNIVVLAKSSSKLPLPKKKSEKSWKSGRRHPSGEGFSSGFCPAAGRLVADPANHAASSSASAGCKEAASEPSRRARQYAVSSSAALQLCDTGRATRPAKCAPWRTLPLRSITPSDQRWMESDSESKARFGGRRLTRSTGGGRGEISGRCRRWRAFAGSSRASSRGGAWPTRPRAAQAPSGNPADWPRKVRRCRSGS